MRLKRRIQCTAILTTLCAGMLFPMAAHAEGEYETPEGITKKSVTYHYFEKDTTGELDVIFKEDMPSVPYIDAADYMGKIMIHEFKEEVKDGKVIVSGEPGTFTVDAEKDQVTFNDYHSMLNDGNFYIRPGSAADVPYIRPTTIDPLGEVKPTTLDLSKYKIDLLMVDGKAYFPLTTISDLFCSSLVTAEYVNGEIHFVFSLENFVTGEMTESYVDRSALYEIQERPKDAAEYTYNEMCFLFDKIYGKPSQCEFANVIRETPCKASCLFVSGLYDGVQGRSVRGTLR